MSDRDIKGENRVKEYISNVYRDLPPENKGYLFVKSVYFFMPLIKANISVTTKKKLEISLVEEIILKLIDKKVTYLDDICGVMGLDKGIVQISLGDLYVKELIYTVGENCILTYKGIEMVKNMRVETKQVKSINHVYINAVNQEVYIEKPRNVVGKYSDKLSLVKQKINKVDIEFWKDNISTLNTIMKNTSDQTYEMEDEEEIIGIDNAETLSVEYLKLKIHIFISEDGQEIDLICTDKNNKKIFDDLKEDILEHIRKNKILYSNSQYGYSKLTFPILKDSSELKKMIYDYVNNPKLKELCEEKLEDEVLKTRLLLPNEVEYIVRYISKNYSKIDVYVDDLWRIISDQALANILAAIVAKATISINYITGEEKAINRIQRQIPTLKKDNIIKSNHHDQFKICFNDNIVIYVNPVIIEAGNKNVSLKQFVLINENNN